MVTVYKINADNAKSFSEFLRKDPLKWGDIIQTNDGSVYTLDKDCNPIMETSRWLEIREQANVVGKSPDEKWLFYCCGSPNEPTYLKIIPAEVNLELYKVLDLPDYPEEDYWEAVEEELKTPY
jgi:hypothetical protein